MGETFPGTSPSERPTEAPLDSWKEIAAYLDRDVTTVQRWEKREGMPVHRHVHDKRGSVYALGSELDAWLQSRRPDLAEVEKDQKSEAPVESTIDLGKKSAVSARHWFALVGIVVLGLLAVVYAVSRVRTENAARPKIRSLAVLPLKNLSGDPAQDYFADGMTDALIGRLARIHDLRVISRTSVMRFKNPQASVPEIAGILHVDAVVEGSVMRDGNRIRVTAQLIRGATDEHFWSETYDREMQDVLTLQSELAQSIAEKVEVTVTGVDHERLTAARLVAPEVYENYLKGRFALDQGNGKAGVEESIGYFDAAIRSDPTFAPAYLGLANASIELATVFIGAPPKRRARKRWTQPEKL